MPIIIADDQPNGTTSFIATTNKTSKRKPTIKIKVSCQYLFFIFNTPCLELIILLNNFGVVLGALSPHTFVICYITIHDLFYFFNDN